MSQSEPTQDRAGRLQRRQLGEKVRRKKSNTIKYVVFLELANASAEEGKFNDALLFYERALDVAQKMDNPELKCDALVELASAADSLNMTDAAIDYYERALKIAREMQDSMAEDLIRSSLGFLLVRTGDFDLGAELLRQARDATIAKRETVIVEERPTPETPTQKSSTRQSLGSSPAIQELTETSNQIAQMDRERQILVYGTIGLAVLGVIGFLITGQVALVLAMNAPLLAVIGRGLFSK